MRDEMVIKTIEDIKKINSELVRELPSFSAKNKPSYFFENFIRSSIKRLLNFQK